MLEIVGESAGVLPTRHVAEGTRVPAPDSQSADVVDRFESHGFSCRRRACCQYGVEVSKIRRGFSTSMQSISVSLMPLFAQGGKDIVCNVVVVPVLVATSHVNVIG